MIPSTPLPTAAGEQRTRLFYQPRDLLLYLFSLAIVGLLGWAALPLLPRALLMAGLGYMALTFVLKHGVELDGSSFAVIARGLWSYPQKVAGRLWHARSRLLIALGVFAAALGLEWLARARVHADSFWLQPFPYWKVVLVPFLLILVFRTAILVAHLRRRQQVRAILETSEWRRELLRMSMGNHVFQAYVSGLISHTCMLMPSLLFWRLTGPTYLREAAMLLGTLATSPWLASVRRMRANDVAFSVPKLIAYVFLLTPGALDDAVLLGEHQRAHGSRFEFTVVHGHHHDSIPSALIGGPGSGFWEAVQQTVFALAFLQGALLMLFLQSLIILFDMTAHQYIPGVFPFSRFVIIGHLHHMVHHYGSVRPLGLTGPPYQLDVDAGYDPDNRRVRWFVEVARQYERLDPVLFEQFPRLSGSGNLRRRSRA